MAGNNIRRRGPHTRPAAVQEPEDEHSSATDTVPRATSPSTKSRPHPAAQASNSGKKRRHTFIFLLGSLFGLVAAGFFAKTNDLIDFPELGELSMDSFFDVLPAGLVTDMRDLVVSIPGLTYSCVYMVADMYVVSSPHLEWRARLSRQL